MRAAAVGGAAGRRMPRIDGGRAALAAVSIYVALFCVIPLLRLFALGLAPEGGGFDPGALLALLRQPATLRALGNTIEAGLLSTFLSVAIGLAMALLVALTDIRAKSVLVFLLLLPMLIPAQITAIAWLELTGPSSPVLGPLGLAPQSGRPNPLYSREGIVLLLGVEHATIVFLTARAALRAVPVDYALAARAAGSGPLRATASIILPLIRPALLAGAALAFVSAIGNFGIPALLGIPGRYPMMTTLIFQRLSGFGPSALGEVASLALILAVLAGAGLLVQTLAARGGRVEIADAGMARPPFALGRWRPPAEALVWGVLVFVSLAPLAALLGASITQAVGVPLTPATATLDHYARVFAASATGRAFLNSASLAGGAALISGVVAVVLAYFIARRRATLARVLDAAVDAPFALPGTVLAIAFILVLLRPLPLIGVSVYGTLWLILAAYLARFLALALRPTVSAMAGLDRAIEEAAQVAGAGTLRRLWSVLLPGVAPAAAAGALLVFMGAFNELTVSVLLWSTGNETLGVLVFNLYDLGDSPGAAAVSALTVAVTLMIALALTGFARALPPGVLPWRA